MYKNLAATLNSEGISKKQYCLILGISEKSYDNKINGVTDFTYSEFKKTMVLLSKYNADYLFKKSDD